MGRCEGARAAVEIEVRHRELLGALNRMRRGPQIQLEKIVGISSTRWTDRSARLRRGRHRTARDVPSLGRVGIEARLKECLARYRLIRHCGEDALHSFSRGRSADLTQHTEGTVRATGIGSRREQ